MSTRILHLSDLHLGARRAQQDATFGLALAGLIERLDPAARARHRRPHPPRHARPARRRGGVPARARPAAARRARKPRRPLQLPGRLTHPWREFERLLGRRPSPSTPRPACASSGSTRPRPLRHQGGRIGRAQLARAVADARRAARPASCAWSPSTTSSSGAPWRSRKRPLARRSLVLGAARRRRSRADRRRTHPPGIGLRGRASSRSTAPACS